MHLKATQTPLSGVLEAMRASLGTTRFESDAEPEG